MEGLKIVNLNVNGLNNANKRRIVFNHLQRTKADLFLLQETHATENTIKMWTQEWVGPIIANNGLQNSRG